MQTKKLLDCALIGVCAVIKIENRCFFVVFFLLFFLFVFFVFVFFFTCRYLLLLSDETYC